MGSGHLALIRVYAATPPTGGEGGMREATRCVAEGGMAASTRVLMESGSQATACAATMLSTTLLRGNEDGVHVSTPVLMESGSQATACACFRVEWQCC